MNVIQKLSFTVYKTFIWDMETLITDVSSMAPVALQWPSLVVGMKTITCKARDWTFRENFVNVWSRVIHLGRY